MKKIILLCGLFILSGSIFAKKNPTREGAWVLKHQQDVHFIEMDMFDQQILTVSVAEQLPNGKRPASINMHCSGKDYAINPGEKAICRTLWSQEVVTLTVANTNHGEHGESAGSYKLTYIS